MRRHGGGSTAAGEGAMDIMAVIFLVLGGGVFYTPVAAGEEGSGGVFGGGRELTYKRWR